MIQPPNGWTTKAKVISVHDGDTLTVEVSRRIDVRLLGCWAPEIRGVNGAELRRGQAAAAYLQALAPIGSDVVLHVPANTADIEDWMTMGRVLGRVFATGRDVSDEMVAAGHATAAKKGPAKSKEAAIGK